MGQMLESIRRETLLARFQSSYSYQRSYPEPSMNATQLNDSNVVTVPTSRTTTSNPQLIPEAIRNGNMLHPPEDSNPSSASTTPVSDTTATETDRSETMAEDDSQQDPIAPTDEQSAE